MVIVENAALAPAQCMFTGSSVGPFIDFLRDYDIEHVGRMYMKTSFALELAQLCGAPSTQTVNDALGEAVALKMRVVELERENQELREFNEAAKYTVEAMGQHIRRKPGRKPQEKPQPQAA